MIDINGRKAQRMGKSRSSAQFSFKAFLSELCMNCWWATKLSKLRFLLFSPYSIKDHERKGVHVQFTKEAIKAQEAVVSYSSTRASPGWPGTSAALSWRASTLYYGSSIYLAFLTPSFFPYTFLTASLRYNWHITICIYSRYILW